MITVERTFDYSLVREVMTHPKVWPHVTDDGSPPKEAFRLIESDYVIYLLAKDGDEVLGVWVLVPHNTVCYEVHTCMLPSAWGARAREAALIAIQFVWGCSSCARLVTNVPEYNRLALRFAKAAGMTEFGRNPRSFLKDGKLWDQIMLGISKGESEPCQQQ